MNLPYITLPKFLQLQKTEVFSVAGKEKPELALGENGFKDSCSGFFDPKFSRNFCFSGFS